MINPLESNLHITVVKIIAFYYNEVTSNKILQMT